MGYTCGSYRARRYAGDVKGLFDNGAINGTYAARTEPGGIGHVGIVIDDAPTGATEGTLGTGNASVVATHSYGHLSLSLSSKAPSAFAAFTAPPLLEEQAREAGKEEL